MSRAAITRVAVAAAALLPGLLAAGAAKTAFATTTTTTTTTTTATASSWTVYHGDIAGSGVAAAARVDLASPAWTSPALDGSLYGEPLVSGGRVFVATENDTVYALSASNGAVVWSTHLATAVPASSLPCGDISPTVGITGTPVIDESRSELFVVADELVDGSPAHELVGLDTASGATELRQDVDPPGSTPAALLQRTGLTLDNGHVVFGFGGNYGDCASYRGWVVSVPEAGGTPDRFAVDGAPGESQGAVWMGGAAPVVDAAGNVWVSTGNGSVYSSSHAYDDSEGVLELSPAMALVQYFAPKDWAAQSSQDLDLSTAPALLADGQVV
ncbi:MAG TPA: PQQ-binding-like beta-propeller repeat protein, partial [Acidimicrobiales bacterium]|nr:PQQ-binding-like beta-propeller repeat protein [Acidimicrobiales bacterium]